MIAHMLPLFDPNATVETSERADRRSHGPDELATEAMTFLFETDLRPDRSTSSS